MGKVFVIIIVIPFGGLPMHVSCLLPLPIDSAAYRRYAHASPTPVPPSVFGRVPLSFPRTSRSLGNADILVPPSDVRATFPYYYYH